MNIYFDASDQPGQAFAKMLVKEKMALYHGGIQERGNVFCFLALSSSAGLHILDRTWFAAVDAAAGKAILFGLRIGPKTKTWDEVIFREALLWEIVQDWPIPETDVIEGSISPLVARLLAEQIENLLDPGLAAKLAALVEGYYKTKD